MLSFVLSSTPPTTTPFSPWAIGGTLFAVLAGACFATTDLLASTSPSLDPWFVTILSGLGPLAYLSGPCVLLAAWKDVYARATGSGKRAAAASRTLLLAIIMLYALSATVVVILHWSHVLPTHNASNDPAETEDSPSPSSPAFDVLRFVADATLMVVGIMWGVRVRTQMASLPRYSSVSKRARRRLLVSAAVLSAIILTSLVLVVLSSVLYSLRHTSRSDPDDSPDSTDQDTPRTPSSSSSSLFFDLLAAIHALRLFILALTIAAAASFTPPSLSTRVFPRGDAQQYGSLNER